jgi:hypothetical protein
MSAARMSKLAALPLAMLLVAVSCGGADDDSRQVAVKRFRSS